MKTRRIGLLLTLGSITSLIVAPSQMPDPIYLIIPTLWIVGIYTLYLIDERTTPITTFLDWSRGQFVNVDDLSTPTLQRRYNIFRYRFSEGPLKIRLLYNWRFTDETTNSLKNEMESRLEE